MGSIWGNKLKISIFGESHGEGVGVVIDGFPAGFKVDFEYINNFLKRRAPGNDLSTSRIESDTPEILSGIKDNFTTGSPICVFIKNNNTQSSDYQDKLINPRPSHADYNAYVKYHGYSDQRGGGHFSGRLTAPLCLAGGIALQILERRNIHIGAHILAIADIEDEPYNSFELTKEHLLLAGQKKFPVNDERAGERMQKAIDTALSDDDSLGGIIEGAVLGLPAGLGSPLFGGIENRLAQILFAIPALTGLEFGSGFASAKLRGSQNNDPFIIRQGQIRTASNNHGGVLGGISSGMPLLFKVAIKPTPSIAQEQHSVDMVTMEETALIVKGRHDPCIAPRAVPCIEAATALALLDMMLEQGRI